MKRGALLAEIDLACKAMPLKRGRRTAKSVRQPLDNQTAMCEQLAVHSHLKIKIPIIIDVRCGYLKFRRGKKLVITYDVDNLLKAILDNLQRMWVINDDRNVFGASIIKYQSTDDHIQIKIYEAKDF